MIMPPQMETERNSLHETTEKNGSVPDVDRGGVALEKRMFPGARVLICEDNIINQDVASSILEMFGIEPVIAETGEEALRCIDETAFDLVLMDIVMPILSGYEAAKRIRSSGKAYKDVPIVAMTGDSSAEGADKCLAAGMNGCVSKPIDIDILYKELLKWLKADGETISDDKAEATFPVNIERIDTESGLRRFNNKAEKYEKALTTFSGELPKVMDEIRAAAAAKNYKAAGELAHRIKGVSGNIGAMELYAAAEGLEDIFAKNKSDNSLLAEFTEKAESVSEAIRNVFMSGKASELTPEKAAGKSEEAFALLSELEQAVEEFDPLNSELIIERLMSKNWPCLENAELQEIHELIDSYQFDEAFEKVGLLLARRI